MSIRTLNGLPSSTININTISPGEAIRLSNDSTNQTVNVDISKQVAVTSIADTDLFVLEQADGSIKKITGAILKTETDTNFWHESNDILRPLYPSSSVLVGGTSMNVNNFKFQVEGNSYLNGNLLVETDTNASNRQLLINGTAEITGDSYLNTISSGTWRGSVLGKAYLPIDTVYDGDIANFITLNSLTTAVNFGTAATNDITIGKSYQSQSAPDTKILGTDIYVGGLTQNSNTSNIYINSGKSYAGDTSINIKSERQNDGNEENTSVNITSYQGLDNFGTSKIILNALHDKASGVGNIEMNTKSELIINTNFKINSSGSITAVGSKITNNLIDTGIADNKIVEIDSSTVVDNDYAKFTANGLEGRSSSEVKDDLSLNNVENTALSTWAGSGYITTLGNIGTGTWNGSNISAQYGGTGFDLYSVGDILYANTTTSLAKLGLGSANTFLMSNGSTPVWGVGYSFSSPLSISGSAVELSGLGGFGSSNQILATNGTNAIQYRTLTQGTNITIEHTENTITISSSENYWKRNTNVGSFDIETNTGVDSIDITVPFVSSSSLKATLGLISGNGDYIKFIDYSSTKPLEIFTKLSTTATYHMAFKHDSTTSVYPLIKQDVNGNFILHWNGEGDRFTFTKDGKLTCHGDLFVDGAKTNVNILQVQKKGAVNGYIELKQSEYPGSATSSNSTRIYFDFAGVSYIYYDGSNLIHTPSFSSSDQRVKKNETLADNSLLAQAFDNINVYKYQYEPQFAIDRGKNPNDYIYGFIAQEVRRNTSNISNQFSNISNGSAVFPNEKIDYSGEKLEVPNMETVNKQDLTFLMWSKIKEQDKLINEMKTTIDKLTKSKSFKEFISS